MFLIAFLFSPLLSSPVHLFNCWFYVFSSDKFPDIHMQTRTYINTKYKGITPYTLSCDLPYAFDNLFWTSFHVSRTKTNKINNPSVVPVSSHWSAISTKQRAVPRVCCALRPLWLCTCHFLYWNAFSSFRGAQSTFIFCEAFPALRKELWFLPSSQNILGILLSSHSSQSFVDAHLLVFFSH